MTLPSEKYYAINWARKFLRSLLIPNETPRVPREIRRQAYSVLKHFPWECDMERIADCKKCSNIIENPYDIKRVANNKKSK